MSEPLTWADFSVRKTASLFGDRVAVFSLDGVYRYQLSVTWSSAPLIHWCMLNPSTADEAQNDPTIERVERRTRRMGGGGYVVTNLFAYRSTDPKHLLFSADPVGPANDRFIVTAAQQASRTICAWGAKGTHLDRHAVVIQALRAAGARLECLALNADGTPKHPLYIAYAAEPIPFDLPA